MLKSYALKIANTLFLFSIFYLLSSPSSPAQNKADTAIHALVVIAHPDDESSCSVTLYKITHQLHGTVDLVCITNGEAGYKYSTLAEDYYGLALTDPEVGRANLPRIRKQELMNAGHILGIRNIYFLDQKDDKYGLNPHAPLDTFWNVQWVKDKLNELMSKTKYDYVFCLLPTPQTHSGHKAATILALTVVNNLPKSQRPIVLGVSGRSKTDTSRMKFSTFSVLDEYPITRINSSAPIFTFDRTQTFGYKNALNYQIIANWEIAEHKSQGTMAMNAEDYEDFYFFSINDPSAIPKTQALFDKLKVNPYPAKTY